jgi:hypothetical protein
MELDITYKQRETLNNAAEILEDLILYYNERKDILLEKIILTSSKPHVVFLMKK